jgi:hypothetical protein
MRTASHAETWLLAATLTRFVSRLCRPPAGVDRGALWSLPVWKLNVGGRARRGAGPRRPPAAGRPPAARGRSRNRTRILIASAGSSSKMTAECEAQPQNSPQALNMRLLGTAHSSNPFGGCAMAVRELGQPPSSGGVPPRAGRLSQGGRRRLWPSR